MVQPANGIKLDLLKESPLLVHTILLTDVTDALTQLTGIQIATILFSDVETPGHDVETVNRYILAVYLQKLLKTALVLRLIIFTRLNSFTLCIHLHCLTSERTGPLARRPLVIHS